MNDIKINLYNENKETFEVTVDGEKFNVEVSIPESFSKNKKFDLINNPTNKNIPPVISKPIPEPIISKGEQAILAPMPGILTSYKKNIGEKVNTGDVVVILEAMKMYNNLYSPCDGIIKDLPFKQGENIKQYDTLCLIQTD